MISRNHHLKKCPCVHKFKHGYSLVMTNIPMEYGHLQWKIHSRNVENPWWNLRIVYEWIYKWWVFHILSMDKYGSSQKDNQRIKGLSSSYIPLWNGGFHGGVQRSFHFLQFPITDHRLSQTLTDPNVIPPYPWSRDGTRKYIFLGNLCGFPGISIPVGYDEGTSIPIGLHILGAEQRGAWHGHGSRDQERVQYW